MTSFHLSGKLAIALLLIAVSSSVRADEPFEQFLEGLRGRGYYDIALQHIDDLEKRSDLPPEFAELLDFERGITYRALGAASRVPADRDQALSRAETYLKKFASERSQNPKAASANAELGELLFDRAQSLLWEADAPANGDRRAELQAQSRAIIDQAEQIYQAAFNQYEGQYKAFPKFIDEREDPEQYKLRSAVQFKYLRTHYNLVRCTYERGQTFDMGTKERNETLIAASEKFESLYQENTKSPIGLQCKLMMGKCFQEQDDLNRALGIYNEVMSNKDVSNAAVRMLAATAQHFRLICLNTDARSEFQLVIQEANTWLSDKNNRSQLFTPTGLGILWEKAVAEEKLAKDRVLEEGQKAAILRQALADSKQVARFAGPYKEAAIAMGRRINASLGEKDAEPRDFDTAFERAKGMISQLKDFKEARDKASSADEIQKAQQAIDVQHNEIGRLFELALQLRNEETPPAAIAQARYLLSFIYMQQRKSFDAFILARHCMNHDRVNDPDSALAATEIAIQSAVQAFNDAAGQDQTFELDLLKGVCEQIITQYPQSAKGNEARLRLGQVYRDLDQPLKAAETYLTISPDYSEYASALMSAGQSYWLVWANAVSGRKSGEAIAEADATPERIDELKSLTVKYLQDGIAAGRTKLGDAMPTAEMAAAEVSLSNILNIDGKFDQTIARLTANGDKSVLAAIDVPDGEERPETGIQSAGFAGQTYRLLLRAYVGTQDIDKALEAMGKLEAVGGQDITGVYTQLGKELQDELERLNQSGETERLSEVRSSFEQFLEKVYAKRDKTDYTSLLWIGETYYGLGQGVKADVAAAGSYYDRATNAYQEILDNKLAEEGSVLAIKLRLVRCKRAQGAYEEAIALAQSILAENEVSLDVQLEAAYTLADWGADSNGVPAKLLTSIDGVEDPASKTKTIWGWSGITRRLLARQSAPEWEALKDRFLEARFELSNSRLRYAKTSAADGPAQLQMAVAEVTLFPQVFSDLDDQWFSKFDQLYQDIQAEQGKSPVALQRPEKVEIPMEELAGTAAAEDETKVAEQQTATAPPVEPQGSNWILTSIALALAAGGGFAFYKLMSKPAQRGRTNFAPAGGTFMPPMGGVGGGSFGAADDDGVPDFSGLAAMVPAKSGSAAIAPPPVKKKAAANSPAANRPAAARPKSDSASPTSAKPATPSSAPGAPVKKKRVLTPEEAVKYRAAKAAQAKAQAAAAAAGSADPGSATPSAAPRPRPAAGDPAAQPRKVVKRVQGGEAQPAEGASQPPRIKKKIVKKRPPQPPSE